VVAPLYNEVDNLEMLYARLRPVLDTLADGRWELILVDDGSVDASWRVVTALHERDPRVRGLRFSRNFGHHNAITAGLDYSRGARVITMDSDLQDQPEELPKLAAKMNEGYELVYAERMERQHSLPKRLASRGFMRLMQGLADLPYPITGAMYRMMSRRFVDELCRLRERHRLFTGLTAWVGFEQASVPVQHATRHAGQTKYHLGKMLHLAADTVTAFSAKPLYYIIYLGAAVSLLAALFALSVIVRYCVTGYSTQGWASLMTAVTFFSGMILFSLGTIGQYVARIFEESKGRPMYIVAETAEEQPVLQGDACDASGTPGRHRQHGNGLATGQQVLSRPEVPRRLLAGGRRAYGRQ
jgi:dolichol-phosphate mannosyltransferase